MKIKGSIKDIIDKFPLDLANAKIPPKEIRSRTFGIDFSNASQIDLLELAVNCCKSEDDYYGITDHIKLTNVLGAKDLCYIETDHERYLHIAESILASGIDAKMNDEDFCDRFPSILIRWSKNIIKNYYTDNPETIFERCTSTIDTELRRIDNNQKMALECIHMVEEIFNKFIENFTE